MVGVDRAIFGTSRFHSMDMPEIPGFTNTGVSKNILVKVGDDF